MLSQIQVESAVALTADQQNQIKAVLRQRGRSQPINFAVNPQLIGGFKISFAGRSVDLSLAYRLETLEEELIRHAG